MTQPHPMRGAVDLSTVGAPAAAAAPAVVEVTDANFDQTMQGSLRYPVVIEFYSLRAPEQQQLSQDLAELNRAAAGRWLLARVDVDAAPRVASTLQIQAVPTVVGVIQGQLVPLWQGTLSKTEAQAYLTQLLSLATQYGVVGTVDTGPAPAGDQPAADPRYDPAYAAMEAEDFATAAAEFSALLQTDPRDQVAKAGLAQAELFGRVAALDPHDVTSRATADPNDVGVILDLADLEAATGHPELAFARLIEVVRGGPGPDREQARTRLLELFESFGSSDPAVLKARRDLATALF